MKLRGSLLCLAIFTIVASKAQLVIDDTMTPTELVEDVLLGGGVTVSNVTFNGVPMPGFPEPGFGSFTSTGTALGIPAGIVLATGELSSIPQDASWDMGDPLLGGGDADLEILTGGEPTFDAQVLEFDFIPTGDQLTFRYVFASDEYPDYVCSMFNDAFGFFMSGPGIAGPFSGGAANIALIPGSNIPIAINTVNNGVPGFNGVAAFCEAADPNWLDNTVYFTDNSFGPDIVFNGFTVALEATVDVQCGETYHIKIAIADAGDDWLDSAVFLEANSFASNGQVLPELSAGIGIVNDTMFEGCGPVEIIFTRTGALDQPLTVDLTAAGTATAVTDYDPAFPATITFQPGEENVSLFFDVPMDADGIETLILTVGEPLCDGSIENEFTFYIDSAPPLDVQLDDLTASCGDDLLMQPVVTGGIGEYEYLWSTTETTPTITAPGSGDIELTVSDACGVDPVTVTATVTIDTEPLVVQMGPDAQALCGEDVQIWVESVTGGDGVYTYEWTLDGVVVGSTDLITVTSGADAWYIVTVSEGCGTSVQDSVQVTSFPSDPILVEVSPETTLPCNGTVDISVVSISGGNGVYTYEWSLNGTVVGNGDTHSASELGTYELLVEDGCGETATATVNVVPDDPMPLSVEMDPEMMLPCFGQVDVAVVSVEGGTAPYTYAWTFQGAPAGNGQSITVDEVGWYVVTVSELCGGSIQDSVQVSPLVTDPISITVSEDLTLPCTNEGQISVTSVNGGTAPYSYQWTVNGVDYSTNMVTNAVASTPTWYVVNVLDACGASAQDSILVSAIVNEDIVVQTAGDVAVICPGETAQLQVTGVFGGFDPIELIWEDPDGATVGNGSTFDAAVSQTTTYTVTAVDVCGSTGIATVTAEVLFSPDLQVTLPDDLTICLGEETEIIAEVTGGSGYYYIQWDGLELTDPVLTVAPTQTSTYNITVIDHCGPTAMANVQVNVEDVIVDILPLNTGQDDWYLQAATQPEAITWIWDMGDSSRYRGREVHHSYYDLEDHWVTLDVTTATGCTGHDSLLIQPPAHLYFPNAFTPDGDGFNEVFGGVGHNLDEFELLIFDRWGELIFTSTAMDEMWDGTVNGTDAQTGVYIYKYKASGHFEPLLEGTGHVTLLRGDFEQ